MKIPKPDCGNMWSTSIFYEKRFQPFEGTCTSHSSFNILPRQVWNIATAQTPEKCTCNQVKQRKIVTYFLVLCFLLTSNCLSDDGLST